MVFAAALLTVVLIAGLVSVGPGFSFGAFRAFAIVDVLRVDAIIYTAKPFEVFMARCY
jgi:hypothetical protein